MHVEAEKRPKSQIPNQWLLLFTRARSSRESLMTKMVFWFLTVTKVEILTARKAAVATYTKKTAKFSFAVLTYKYGFIERFPFDRKF